jgi:hypothetical protein
LTADSRPLREPTVSDIVFALASAPGFNGGRGINVLLWSEPGMGKTEMVKYVMRQLDRNSYYLNLSQSDPTDVAGLPRVIKHRGQIYTQKVPDAFLMAVRRDPKAALIVDDITNAVPATQAAGLSLILGREFSDGKGGMYTIGHAPIVAMANHGDAAALTPLLAPMANRFVHIFIGPDSDGLAYVREGRKPQLKLDVSLNQTIDRDWDARYAKASTLVQAFIKQKGASAISKQPTDFMEVESYAWATVRTWEFAARCMAAADHYGLRDQRLLEGCLGKTMSKEFDIFRRSLQLPSLEDLYAGKVEWTKLRPSEKVVLLQEGASDASTDDQLEAVLDGMTKVRELSAGSDDLLVPARDTLLGRTRGQGARALTRPQAARVQAVFRAFEGPETGIAV